MTQAISRREAEILELVGGHLTNAEIADRLVLSVRTVESHVAALIRKLDVADRRALARLAETRDAPSSLGSLPEAMAPFIGREPVVHAILTALGTARLVTLAGPGGAGKTRTAVEVARRLVAQDRLPVWFVDLAPLASYDEIVDAIAGTIGVRQEPGRTTLDAVTSALGRSRCLLLLDNGEHLVRDTGSLVVLLLRRDAGLRVLLTSRESLALAGERVVHLGGLDLPAPDARPDQLADTEAVRLFADRALAVRPDADPLADPAAVASIVRRLDGLPLAIELAAANMLALDPRQIDERLRGRFTLLAAGGADPDPRHGTLRTALEWSYQLMAPREQALFDMLAVFRGSFTLEALEAVHAQPDTQAPADIAADIAALVRKSLVTVVPPAPGTPGGRRFRMLETIRELAQEHFDASGEAERWRNRHFEWAVALVAAAVAGFHGRDQLTSYRMVDADLENIEAALEWAVMDPGRASAALVPVVQLQAYWLAVGTRRNRGALWSQRISEAATSRPAAQRASALRVAASLVMFHDLAQADDLIRASWELAGDDPLGRVHARMAETYVNSLRAVFTDDWMDEARAAGLPELHQAGLRIYLSLGLGDRPAEAYAQLMANSGVFEELGDRHMAASVRAVASDFGAVAGAPDALEVCRASLEVAREFGCRSCISSACSALSVIDVALPVADRLALAREAVGEGDAIGETFAVLMAIEATAAALAETGDLTTALLLTEACVTARRASGFVSILPARAIAGARASALARAALPHKEVDRLATRGRLVDYREMVEMALG